MKLPKGLKLPPGEVAIAVRVDANTHTLRIATASGKVLRYRYAADVYEPVGESDHTWEGVPQHVERAQAAAKQAAREAQEQQPQPQPQPSGGGGGKPQPGGDGPPPPPSKPRDYTAEEWIELATARFDEWDVALRTHGGNTVSEDDIRCACKHDHHLPQRCWNVADVRAVIYDSIPQNYCEACARIALRDFTVLLKRDPIPQDLQEGDIVT